MRIGRRIHPTYTGYFGGIIDEVRVWNVARSAAEIATNKNTEFCQIPSNLVAYFKLNEGIVNGNNYTSTGIYIDSMTNALGCDSIIETHLTIAAPVHGIDIQYACGSFQWIDCATLLPILGATSQSFLPSQTGAYAVVVTLNNGSDTSQCMNFSDAGLFTQSVICNLYPNPIS